MTHFKFAEQLGNAEYNHVLPISKGLVMHGCHIGAGYKELWTSVLLQVVGLLLFGVAITAFLAPAAEFAQIDSRWIWASGLVMTLAGIFALFIEDKLLNQDALWASVYHLDFIEERLEKLARELGLKGYEQLKDFTHHQVRQMALDTGARIALHVRMAKQEGRAAGCSQLELRDFHELLEQLELAPDGGISAYGRRASELELEAS